MRGRFDFHKVNGDGKSGMAIAVFNNATMSLDIRMVNPEEMCPEDDTEGDDQEYLLGRLGYDARLCAWAGLETMTIDVPDASIDEE